MTEPSDIPPGTDPITAILIGITQIRGDLRAALHTQAQHANELDRHDTRIGVVENRVTVLETARAGDNDHEQRNVSNRAVFWTAAAGLAAIIGLIITLFVSTHGG